MTDMYRNNNGFTIAQIALGFVVLFLIIITGYIVNQHRLKPVTKSVTITTSKSPPTTQKATLEPLISGSNWDGHKWYITDGSMTGVIQGKPSNVLVDQNGYLHLRISNNNGLYTAGELFSIDNIGFGTYQWQIEGDLDNLDSTTVVGLFLYGPQNGVGVDGEDEIDVEFSRWANTLCNGACNADFTVYPSTGNFNLGQTQDDFTVGRSGQTITTARVTWTSTSITGTIMNGLEPLGTVANVIHSWTFAPPDHQARIPQQPLPIAMNLWSFEKPPTSNQEVIIRDFQYKPL